MREWHWRLTTFLLQFDMGRRVWKFKLFYTALVYCEKNMYFFSLNLLIGFFCTLKDPWYPSLIRKNLGRLDTSFEPVTFLIKHPPFVIRTISGPGTSIYQEKKWSKQHISSWEHKFLKSPSKIFKKNRRFFVSTFHPIFFCFACSLPLCQVISPGPCLRCSIGQGQECLHGLLRRWRFGVEDTFAADFPTEKKTKKQHLSELKKETRNKTK